MDNSLSGNDGNGSFEAKWRSEAEEKVEKEFAPFTYPSFVNSDCKKLIIITCVAIIIVGLIVISSISRFFPGFDLMMEGMAAETPTEEQDAAAALWLTCYGIAVIVLIGIAIVVSIIERILKKKVAMRNYECAKNAALNSWQQDKINTVNAVLRKKVFTNCPFCNKELWHDYEGPKDKSYYEKVYDVTATGYNTATVTPRLVRQEYIDDSDSFDKYSCSCCRFSIERRARCAAEIDVWNGSKRTYEEIKNTLLYSFI